MTLTQTARPAAQQCSYTRMYSTMTILLLHSNIIYITFFFKDDNAIVLVGRGGGAVQNVQYIIRYANDLAWVTFFRVRNVCTCALIIIIINGIREHYEPKTAARRQYICYTVYLLYIIICLLYYYAYCIILCM